MDNAKQQVVVVGTSVVPSLALPTCEFLPSPTNLLFIVMCVTSVTLKSCRCFWAYSVTGYTGDVDAEEPAGDRLSTASKFGRWFLTINVVAYSPHDSPASLLGHWNRRQKLSRFYRFPRCAVGNRLARSTYILRPLEFVGRKFRVFWRILFLLPSFLDVSNLRRAFGPFNQRQKWEEKWRSSLLCWRRYGSCRRLCFLSWSWCCPAH